MWRVSRVGVPALAKTVLPDQETTPEVCTSWYEDLNEKKKSQKINTKMEWS